MDIYKIRLEKVQEHFNKNAEVFQQIYDDVQDGKYDNQIQEKFIKTGRYYMVFKNLKGEISLSYDEQIERRITSRKTIAYNCELVMGDDIHLTFCNDPICYYYHKISDDIKQFYRKWCSRNKSD